LAVSLAASDYLVKPIDLEELAAAISRRIAEV
jgi:DNA-binding response OmpR family regulator